MRFLYLLVLITSLFLLNSCKKYVPADASFFIKPTVVSVITTSGQGSGSHKITDLWLYVDGKFQGAYPSGNLMPIITKNKKVKINILAGIKNNGISGTRLSWVFYDVLKLDTLVENGKTIEIPINFKYNAFTNFAWMEDFDGSGFSLIKSTLNPSDVTWKFASTTDSFEGKSAEISLSGSETIAQVESAITYTLPAASSNVYLEINYKANQKFEVGVLAGNESKPALILNPTDTWNKIYIQLANVVNMAPNASAHKVYFRMYKTSDNANPKMFLDNIKLVYL